MRRVPPLVVLVLLAVLATGAAPGAAAPPTRPCPDQPGFSCGVLAVPRDRADPAGPPVYLPFAVQSAKAQRSKPVLVALTGGPGQSGADFGSSFAESLKPALKRYRLAVIDQRGTGAAGALDCPELQRTTTLDASSPAQIAECAALLGPRRAFYGTRDTVADLDALRVRLRQSKLALMGVSYGTFVAQQYARVHPDRTRALILDSVVGAAIDPFLLDTFQHQPRALREQCAKGLCSRVTQDPVADEGAVAATIAADGIRGVAFDARGRARATAYRHPEELANLLVAGDLNPYLQAALPGAVAAARAGDPSLLLRLARIGIGGPTKLRELSVGLFYATTCADQTAPYALTAPFDERDAATEAALAAVDPVRYAPYAAATVLRGSNAYACSRWPQDRVLAPSTAPLPDVPALIFGGRLDQRTPVENGVVLARELPRAQIVTVRGTGHDVLDSDLSGCAQRALTRWVDGKPVGTPCRNESNQVRTFPRPPRSLADLRRAPGVPGDRGRALIGTLDTATDARITLLQQIYAALPASAGGLRGGSFSTADLESETRTPRLILRRYAYVPGLRVSGQLYVDRGTLMGTLRVSGTPQVSGVLHLRKDGTADGRLGGRAVRYTPPEARASAAAGGADAGPTLTQAVGPLPPIAGALARTPGGGRTEK